MQCSINTKVSLKFLKHSSVMICSERSQKVCSPAGAHPSCVFHGRKFISAFDGAFELHDGVTPLCSVDSARK